ncbi:putative PurR-regulated permease PerM [Sinorhizobium fredii]
MDDAQSPVKAEPAGAPASIEPRVTEFLRLGVLALFAYWSLTLVAPFAIIAIWAGILAVALYPVFRALSALFGGRPRLAAAAITLLALLVIAGPLAAIALSFAEAVQAGLGKLAAGTLSVPAPPDAVRDWPLIGHRLHDAWAQASGNLEATLQRLAPSLLQAGGTVLGKIAGIGVDLIGFIVSVIIAGFLFRPGPRLGEGLKLFARRVAGERGAGFVDLAAATIRNVARGVIGVALLQALLAGLAFSLFGIPAASVLAFAVLIFCIMQIGPAPGAPAGRRLGLDGDGNPRRPRPDAGPGADRADRQRLEAGAGRPRPEDADARHPRRGDRRHALLRVDRPLPRADRARRLLRSGCCLDALRSGAGGWDEAGLIHRNRTRPTPSPSHPSTLRPLTILAVSYQSQVA